MIQTPDRIKRYRSAHERFLKPAIVNFFAREFQGAFGPIIRENIAEALIKLVDEVYPEKTRIKPGQILWSALDKNTRGDSPNRRYKAVVLTIVSDEDINMLEKGAKKSEIQQKVIARIINEAYQQGGILSMRDIGLIMVTNSTNISYQRIKYETKHRVVLPHTGVLHDMGSSISHKYQIVYKYVVEKKDPLKIARETNHSSNAVDRYLKDYNRVKTLINENKDIDYMNFVTNIAKPVIKQYLQLIKDYAQ